MPQKTVTTDTLASRRHLELPTLCFALDQAEKAHEQMLPETCQSRTKAAA